MAKKKSPNAALIESLTPAKRIPYDPELMQAWGDADWRDWQKFNALRRDVYRRIMPTVWTEVLEAERSGDVELVKAIQMRADKKWSDTLGVPAITSWQNLEIVMATVAAARYPATDAGLHAWVCGRIGGPSIHAKTIEEKPQLPHVDMKNCQVRWNGECHPVTGDQAQLLHAAVQAYPEWFRAEDYSTKASALKKKLPAELQPLLESASGKGYRLKLP